MPYFLGVDGGTSRMEAIVLDNRGRVAGWGKSGPIYMGNDQNHPQAREHLLDCITLAMKQAGITGKEVGGTCLTLSNWHAGRIAQAREWLAPLKLAGGLQVSQDGPGAWAAAGYPDPCVVVLLGTFSGIGGFLGGTYVQFPLNDWDLDYEYAVHAEGHVIGSKALAAAILSECDEPTDLFFAFCSHLGVRGVQGLMAWAASHQSRRERAVLCELAADVARQGDSVAQRIFARAGSGAARATVAAARWQGCEEVTVVLAGNVWQAGELIRRSYDADGIASLPRARIVGPVHQAEGAALLARREFRAQP